MGCVRTRLPLAAVLALLLAGCGAERLPVPDPARPAPPVGTRGAAFPQAGLRFQAPGGWAFEAGRPPLIATMVSGTATIAVWRYPRTEPLPDTAEQLEAARRQLEQAVRIRDPGFEQRRSRTLEIDGAPAVQITGTTTIAGRRRVVRSTHVYAKEAEVVVDEYAAEPDFGTVDRSAFRPLLRSLKIDPPAAA